MLAVITTGPEVAPAVAVTCAWPCAFVVALVALRVAGPLVTAKFTVAPGTGAALSFTCTISGLAKAVPSLAVWPLPERVDRKSVVEGVTGVQTCALPIYRKVHRGARHRRGVVVHLHDQRIGESRSFLGRLATAGKGRSEERRGGSDWSSDVCSSDLPQSSPWRPAPARRCRSPARSADWRKPFLPWPSGHCRKGSEIGRASCRERVLTAGL